jgi:hypothetical protein
MREYTINKKLASLARAVVLTFTEDSKHEQFERRLCKFVPRGERELFRKIIAVRLQPDTRRLMTQICTDSGVLAIVLAGHGKRIGIELEIYTSGTVLCT